MTEWWVSQAKHWCTICRVWTGGHKGQILKHETGRAHIENEERSIKDAGSRDKKRRAEEQDLKEQLAEIERKALAAMAADAAPPPPPAGSVATGSGGGPGGTAMDAHRQLAAAAQEAEKRKIEEVIAGAKRRKVETDPVALAWTKHADPTSKATYYYNSITKASSWTVPDGFVEAAASAADKVPDGPCANGSPWTASTDPSSGSQYFYNSVTKESSWVRPAEFVPANANLTASQPAASTVATVAAINSAAAAAAAAATSTASQPAFSKAPAAAPTQAGPRMLSPEETELLLKPDVVAQPSLSKCGTKVSAADLELLARASAGEASAAAPAASPAAAAAGSSPWVVCTDPTTGHIYYFNMTTKSSSWEKPADLGVDLSKPPPPPKQKPPGPPKKKESNGPTLTIDGIGGWEEVAPEESMWKPTSTSGQQNNQPDSDEEQAVDDLTAMKYLTMQRGAWMDEDYERHEKETIEKNSSSGSGIEAGAKFAFPINRKKASGTRKRDDAEEDARCV